jgi:dCMP deaminase
MTRREMTQAEINADLSNEVFRQRQEIESLEAQLAECERERDRYLTQANVYDEQLEAAKRHKAHLTECFDRQWGLREDDARLILQLQARVKELEELMEGTARYVDARSELFTSDADCAMYMAKKLRAALSTTHKGGDVTDWDRRFLDLAHHVAQWSKDPSTQVGAVIVRPDKTIASLGYNGIPRGVEDRAERLNDRPTKYSMTLHAEANAILSAHEPVRGYTLYVSPLHPCSNCAALIIQAGISRVVTKRGDVDRWSESFATARTMFGEAGVEIALKE